MTLPASPTIQGLAAQYPDGIPSPYIDIFSKRNIYVSSIVGQRAGCDPDTGRTATGSTIPLSTGQANAAAINTVLATASPTNPVHIVFDMMLPTGRPLVTNSHCTLSGPG